MDCVDSGRLLHYYLLWCLNFSLCKPYRRLDTVQISSGSHYVLLSYVHIGH